MPRRSAIPTYRLHKQSGQAIVTLTDGLGSRWDVLLGKYDTRESRDAYHRVLREWEAAGRKQAGSHRLTVNELLVRFMEHAEKHYCDAEGNPTSELRDYKTTLRPLRLMYGFLRCAEFSPLKLKAVREQMINGGLSRGVINQRVGRIVRVWKWAVAQDLVPAEVWRALTAVGGLQQGRTEARETQPVQPVPDDVVEATLPFLTVPVAAIVRLQRLTGARPGELCRMRAREIDRSGPVWFYKPALHKTAHKGKVRSIAIGPKGQVILAEFLTADPDAFLFSPIAAREQHYTKLRARRKTPVQPSQRCRRKRRPQLQPGERYTTSALGKAIAKACARAFPPPPPVGRFPAEPGENGKKAETVKAWRARLTAEQIEELREWNRAHRWHAHQLRHSAATEIRRQHGLEAAQVVLGHAAADVTQVYAERDQALAAKVAEKMG